MAQDSGFASEYLPTVGFRQAKTVQPTADNDTAAAAAELTFWDSSGAQDYEEQAAVLFRKASAFMVVFDLSDPGSFESVPHILDRVSERCQHFRALQPTPNSTCSSGGPTRPPTNTASVSKAVSIVV